MTIDLVSLRRLAEAATPGPWSVFPPDAGTSVARVPGILADKDKNRDFRCTLADCYYGSEPQDNANAAFIAAANPATFLKLLAVVEAAKIVDAQLDTVPMGCEMNLRDTLRALDSP